MFTYSQLHLIKKTYNEAKLLAGSFTKQNFRRVSTSTKQLGKYCSWELSAHKSLCINRLTERIYVSIIIHTSKQIILLQSDEEKARTDLCNYITVLLLAWNPYSL